MLPAARTHTFSLADVVPNCLEALAGRRGALGLAPVSHAIVLLADGLGQAALETRRGHARHLAARLGLDAPIDTVVPTTTASAIASLTTGEQPGRHGMVGYAVRDPASDRVINQLTGWGEAIDPATWQRVATLFERAREGGVAPIAIGPPRYRDSGFSRAVLRGAEYRDGQGLADRVREARRSLAESGPRLIYLYAPELDIAGHAHGIDSAPWIAALESLDAAVSDLATALGPGHGLLVTGDHGMVDVAPAAHRIVASELLEGVRQVAGEPRGLQLHLEPGVDPELVAERWRASEGARAWVATRSEAISAGLFGPVDDEVVPRLGEVFVFARKALAYYLDAAAPSRGMVGQHGSLTSHERSVPLLRFGAFAA